MSKSGGKEMNRTQVDRIDLTAFPPLLTTAEYCILFKAHLVLVTLLSPSNYRESAEVR